MIPGNWCPRQSKPLVCRDQCMERQGWSGRRHLRCLTVNARVISENQEEINDGCIQKLCAKEGHCILTHVSSSLPSRCPLPSMGDGLACAGSFWAGLRFVSWTVPRSSSQGKAPLLKTWAVMALWQLINKETTCRSDGLLFSSVIGPFAGSLWHKT